MKVAIDNKEITFQVLQKYIAKVEDYGLAKDSLSIQIEDRIEYLGKLIIASWNTLGHQIAEDKYPAYFEYKTPSTVWQMFKKEHMPKWFRVKYPVQYTTHRIKRTVRFTRMATYPKANIAIPKQSTFFIKTLGNYEQIEDKVTYE